MDQVGMKFTQDHHGHGLTLHIQELDLLQLLNKV